VCFRISSCCIQDGETSNLADDKLLCLSETNTTPIQGETKYAHMLFIARFLRKNKSNVFIQRVMRRLVLTTNCVIPLLAERTCLQTVVLSVQFCEWLRHQNAADELFLHNVLWTDEAYFTREGVFNVHNSYLWARDNPHAVRERRYQVRLSVSVWAGIVGDIVVGSYLLSDRLTTQR
jgi:hypothetical protein